jgi:hypothetical protein
MDCPSKGEKRVIGREAEYRFPCRDEIAAEHAPKNESPPYWDKYLEIVPDKVIYEGTYQVSPSD